MTLRLDRRRLLHRRQLAGETQETLARSIGSTQPHISCLERGAVSASPRFIKKLADGLGCDVLDIATLDDDVTPLIDTSARDAITRRFASTLGRARRRAGWTIAEAALLAGVEAATIERWESAAEAADVVSALTLARSLAFSIDALGTAADESDNR